MAGATPDGETGKYVVCDGNLCGEGADLISRTAGVHDIEIMYPTRSGPAWRTVIKQAEAEYHGTRWQRYFLISGCPRFLVNRRHLHLPERRRSGYVPRQDQRTILDWLCAGNALRLLIMGRCLRCEHDVAPHGLGHRVREVAIAGIDSAAIRQTAH